MSALTANLLAFGRLLRTLGLDVSPAQSRDALVAVAAVGVARRSDVQQALRATLVSRAADLPIFDAAFAAFWKDHGERWGRRDLRSLGDPHGTTTLQVEVVIPETDAADVSGADAEGNPAPPLPSGEIQTWSGADTLRDQDFADVTPAELDGIRAALAALVWQPGRRRTRRWVAGDGARLDVRRIWRHQLRAGELVRLPRRQRTTRPRPLVLVADVSGSMERYSRMLLHFAYALQRARARVEVFLFATRLTRVTRELSRGSIDAAITAVSRQVPDWSGGTRIGDALRAFHVRWARSVLSRRPVVLVVSDGWDRGDPGLLQQQVARLQRSSHRLIWLSPLLGTADYQPLTRGLVAALPYVDDFLPARTLRNLEDLAAHLNTLPIQRPLRRQPPDTRITP
ncbi:MAG: VWA domain-containing protein [Vicinamibacterales bacterium]